MQRRDRVRLAETEIPQAGGLSLGALVIDLVGGQHDGLLGGAKDLDDLLVDIGDADGGIDDEQHGVGDLDRDLGLSRDALGETAGVGIPAAGVDDGERTTVPDRVVVDAVAGDSGHVFDDGFAAADDAVDERGLADVGSTDHGKDGYGLSHRMSLSARGRAARVSARSVTR